MRELKQELMLITNKIKSIKECENSKYYKLIQDKEKNYVIRKLEVVSLSLLYGLNVDSEELRLVLEENRDFIKRELLC